MTKKHYKPPFKKKSEKKEEPANGLLNMFTGLMKGFENVVQKETPEKPSLSNLSGAFLKGWGTLSGLKQLDLQGCKLLVDSQLEYLSQLKGVESINLSGTKITGECFKACGELPHLEEIILANCRYLTDEGLAHLGKLKGLKRLAISMSDIEGSCFKEWGALQELQEFHLRGCVRLNEDNLVFLNRLTKLEVVDLAAFDF